MWFFKKKKKEVITPSTPIKRECQHKWKDFPWYIDARWGRFPNNKNYWCDIELKEPYVCIWCKKREDILLKKWHREPIREEDIITLVNEINTRHKSKIKSREEIEDEIQDFLHDVDRTYLQIYEKIHNQNN